MTTRIYFCAPFPEAKMKASRGAIARAEALAAGHPKWWEVTSWPEQKTTYEPDPKIKTPKKPKKGGKKK